MTGEVINGEYYIGQTFNGSYPPDAAIWCNNNNCYIEADENKNYIIKEVVHTDEEYADQVRGIRDSYLAQYIDKVNYIWYSSLSAEEQNSLANYRKYLLDIPQSEYFPYSDSSKSEIMTVLNYEDWKAIEEK